MSGMIWVIWSSCNAWEDTEWIRRLARKALRRLARYNFPRNPYFGRLRGAGYGRLKEVMEQLLVSGHLTRPAGAYITIKTTPKSEEILSHDVVFKIKRRQ